MATRIYSAGQLDQRVQWQRRTASADALGEAAGAWVDDGAPVWAAVQPVRAQDRLQGGGLQQVVDVVLVVRHRAGRSAVDIMAALPQGLRLVWRGQPLDVVGAIAVDGGLAWVEVSAVHGVRDGR